MGDRLLCGTAERLASCIRQDDTAARLGGDEFVVLLVNLHDTNDVKTVARKILDALNAPFHITGRALEISASIGIALFPHDTETPDNLISKADRAMYSAKRAGRNRFLFSEDLDGET